MGTRRTYTEEILSRTVKAFGIDTSHFRVYSPSSHSSRRLLPEQILGRLPPERHRTTPPLLTRALIESGAPYSCVVCGCDGSWLGMPLTLEVDHIDGDYLNNLSSNLRLLCPNCHRQTDNFAGRSTGKYSGHASAARALDLSS